MESSSRSSSRYGLVGSQAGFMGEKMEVVVRMVQLREKGWTVETKGNKKRRRSRRAQQNPKCSARKKS